MRYCSQEDRDDVRAVQSHSSHGENGVDRNGACKVEQPREDSDDGDKPDGANGSLSPRADVAEISTIRETLITTEGIDCPRRCLQGGLADEECREADKRLQRCFVSMSIDVCARGAYPDE